MPASFEAAPDVVTERLRLRAYRLSDFPAYRAMWGDPEVTRHIGGKPLSEPAAWEKFLRHSGHWRMMGYGGWAVTAAAGALDGVAEGEFLGHVGFACLRRDIDPPLGEAPEIGWVLTRSAAGRGIATEAAQAAIDWAARHVGDVESVCMIDEGNVGSLRVAAKCGYDEYARAPFMGRTVVLLRRRLGSPDPPGGDATRGQRAP